MAAVIPPHVTPGAPVTGDWGNLVSDALTDHETRITANVLIGEMKIWPGDTVPNVQWMFCRGQTISRTTYALLYGIVGNKFGPGDGTTTFNLPDMQGHVPVGLNTAAGQTFSGAVGTKFGRTDAVLPTHAHSEGYHQHGVNIWSASTDRDHAHYVSASTSDVNQLHRHSLAQLGTFFRYNPYAPAYEVRVNDGQSHISMDLPDAGAFTTEPEGYHVHAIGTWSGGQNTGHLHAVNGSTDSMSGGAVTGSVGQNAKDMNIQPSMYVNYIIKVV